MKQYLTKFSNRAAFEAELANLDYPNVTYLSEDDEMVFAQNAPEPETDWSKEYLTFLALEDGTFTFSRYAINYSLDDGQTWTELPTGTNTPTVTAGGKIKFKGNIITSSGYGIGPFSSTARYEVMGNPYSLKYGDDFGGELESSGNEFKNLFSGSTGLTSAEHLAMPDIPLAGSCYQKMFYGCTSMFQGCTSLTTAPELPAEELVNYCYEGMFFGCTSLNYIKMLAPSALATNCLVGWVSGVASSGTFVKHPDADLPTGANGIPEGWTVETATA